MKSLVLCVVIVIPLLYFVPVASPRGKQRWAVKVAKDPHNKYLFKNAKTTGKLKVPKPTDIKTLVNVDNRFKGHLPPDFNRVSGIETTIWQIHGFITNFKEEAGSDGDHDYHIALRDPEGNQTKLRLSEMKPLET